MRLMHSREFCKRGEVDEGMTITFFQNRENMYNMADCSFAEKCKSVVRWLNECNNSTFKWLRHLNNTCLRDRPVTSSQVPSHELLSYVWACTEGCWWRKIFLVDVFSWSIFGKLEIRQTLKNKHHDVLFKRKTSAQAVSVVTDTRNRMNSNITLGMWWIQ